MRKGLRKGLPHRRGLAPLEMTLVLPLLLVIMMIILAFGTITSWKLKGEWTSRDMAWRSRSSHHFTPTDWRNWDWPQPGEFAATGGADISDYTNPVIDDPMIVGPIPQLTVNDRLMDFRRSVREGVVDLERGSPGLQSLGNMDFTVRNALLTDRFQIYERNSIRRIPSIWESGLDQIKPSAEYQNALRLLTQHPAVGDLEAIDDDREFDLETWPWWSEIVIVDGEEVEYTWRPNPPNRYPFVIYPEDYRTISLSWLNDEWVRSQKVERYCRSIDRVPRNLARSTISLYSWMLNPLGDNPPEPHPHMPQGVETSLQQMIEALEEYLEELEAEGY